MLSTFTKGIDLTAPSWLAGFLAAAKENGGEQPARIHARVEMTKGDPYVIERDMAQMRSIELTDFLGRFVHHATQPGVTLAELGFTHPCAKITSHINEVKTQHASAFAGIGLFAKAVSHALHPSGQCAGATWISLAISPTE